MIISKKRFYQELDNARFEVERRYEQRMRENELHDRIDKMNERLWKLEDAVFQNKSDKECTSVVR